MHYPLEFSDNLCSANPESSTLLQVSDHDHSGDDKNNSDLDLVLLLYEQENLAVLPRKDTRGDGGFMDQSNAINRQKETCLPRPLESFDKLELIMQDSSKSSTFLSKKINYWLRPAN
ncbi:hypothetical protein NC652_007129 [Populus alba x Populus x berolinensis]|nr:hypothetical protein NC652_007129 [Populus alba x Populus x berolinensis]